MSKRFILCIIIVLGLGGLLAAQEFRTAEIREAISNTTEIENGAAFDSFLIRFVNEHQVFLQKFMKENGNRNWGKVIEANSVIKHPEDVHVFFEDEEEAGFYIMTAGLLTYHGSMPLVVARVNPDRGGIQYLSAILPEPVFDFSTPKPMLVDMMIITGLLWERKNIREDEMNISSEAQTAISTIRKCYDVYLQTNGTTRDYTIERAMKDARLGERTLMNWTFEVAGNPPRKIIATSTESSLIGAGYQVWYDTSEAKFHGYGVDQFEDPSEY